MRDDWEILLSLERGCDGWVVQWAKLGDGGTLARGTIVQVY